MIAQSCEVLGHTTDGYVHSDGIVDIPAVTKHNATCWSAQAGRYQKWQAASSMRQWTLDTQQNLHHTESCSSSE